jgi:hypothetical protein
MKESDIKIGRTYAGGDWKTLRKVEQIETDPGRFGSTYVLYSRVGGQKGMVKKYLCHFAFEAEREVLSHQGE